MDGCAGALLSLIALHREKQLQRDGRAESARRTRTEQRAAAGRVRLRRLRLQWKRRRTQLSRARMARFEAHRMWMEGVSVCAKIKNVDFIQFIVLWNVLSFIMFTACQN